MTLLSDLRAALAANLSNVSGLAQSPYVIENPTPPCAEVEPGPTRYDLVMSRGLDEWSFTVRVFVSENLNQGAQRKLDAYMASSGTDSIKAAIESDRKLGGKCDDLHVVGNSGYRRYARGGSDVLGCEWEVQVFAQGA